MLRQALGIAMFWEVGLVKEERKKAGEADSVTVVHRRTILFLAARHLQQGLT